VTAIDRDREAYEKATPGKWLADTDRDNKWKAGVFTLLDSICDLSSHYPNAPQNAAHIVRLHNRQPLYLALAATAAAIDLSDAARLNAAEPDAPIYVPLPARLWRAIRDARANLEREDTDDH